MLLALQLKHTLYCIILVFIYCAPIVKILVGWDTIHSIFGWALHGFLLFHFFCIRKRKMPTREKREKRWTGCPKVLDPHSLLLYSTYEDGSRSKSDTFFHPLPFPSSIVDGTLSFSLRVQNTTRQLPSFILRSLTRYLRIYQQPDLSRRIL